ncbi:MAG: SPFH domain-containing protein [Candidatus Heimdallarchaeota archaeon]|nr:SPFH domain-containing protein [Candidatus Heimdallarchaeota archaeon]MCK4770126.1 SPFH domain-containing protein [Candidatus Heimdallarchaeota archaeon]
MEFYVTIIVVLVSIIAFVLIIMFLAGIKIIMEYERMVVFRLGRYKRTIGPGLVYVTPIMESARKVDLRIITQDIPRQEVMTKDNIPVLANTVVYFKVERPADAVIKIENYVYAVRQYTQAALRDTMGTMELDQVLIERDKIAQDIREIVDKETSEWGIDIQGIKIQEIELPAEMKRAFAKQAEAEREKRAAIIQSQGELTASQNLADAAENLSKHRGALALRTLQTIRDIAQDPSEKIVIFMPNEISEGITEAVMKKAKK